MTGESPKDDVLESILPGGELVHATAAELPLAEFKPWHLPRKHFVRKEQWAAAVARLCDDLPDRKLIKYLCLPGEDLLDVQTMVGVCQAKGRSLKYLGFDESIQISQRSTQRVSAEQIVRQMAGVDATSDVVADSFVSVARVDSQGSRYLRDGGSYDVVNLDMCDAFTSDARRPTHDALVELITHQCNRRGEPWLLFVTTRSETDRIAAHELAVYLERIKANAVSSADFRAALARIAECEAREDVESLCAEIGALLPEDTGLCGRVLTVGIGKWLLGILAQQDPWRVDLLSLWCYRTGLLADGGSEFASGPPNLFSLAFRFEKIKYERSDPSGLAAGHAVGSTRAGRFADFNETALAEKMVRCVVMHTRDVDRDLQAAPPLHSALLEECAALLRVRYYSEADYRAWVAKLPQIPC